MKKFLHADWLRACQSILKLEIFGVQKDKISAKEKLTDGQSNLLFSNQAQALDGTIHGAIFP